MYLEYRSEKKVYDEIYVASADLELTSREKFQASRLDLRRRPLIILIILTTQPVQGPPHLIGLLIITFKAVNISCKTKYHRSSQMGFVKFVPPQKIPSRVITSPKLIK